MVHKGFFIKPPPRKSGITQLGLDPMEGLWRKYFSSTRLRKVALARTRRIIARFVFLKREIITFEMNMISVATELVDDIKYRPPIFRKKTENEEKCANFKGKIQFYREIQL